MSKSLLFAWVTAIIATLGSLYFSEFLHFIPCTLCWYQRIFMYPLTILLGIAVFRNDRRIGIYILPLTIIGSLFSLLHLGEQHFGWFEGICRSGIPCSGRYINWLGFITIPLLAFIAFISITFILILELKDSGNRSNP